MTDGHRDNSVGERKLIWDEENRLLAVDDNGFVSNYWYDADGERTVKTSGESDQVYVNGVFSGGSTNTAKFSLYVSPYLVANQGGRYTKHIYAGSQRIVSKVGDFASYGSDPRRIEYAGANTDGLSVDYKSKYAAQQQVIKDNYKFFDVPYNGVDNDNYADGEGFCCNDGSMEAAVAQARKAQVRAVSRSFKDPDNYENLQFFYHPDHLGSSSFITNLDGEVVQHIEYVPFGEVFIEERNNVWNTPYLFNAKEFDEETGMYYYGARYYDPRISLWMSIDPLKGKKLFQSPYSYECNNPVRYIDPDGRDEWDINSSGKIVNHVKNDKNDSFFMVDDEGKRIDNKSLTLPYKTVIKAYSKKNDYGVNYDTYKTRGDENSTKLFEFLAQNTSVEWSHAKTGLEGEQGLNFITSSHKHAEESGISDLIKNQLSGGYTVRTLNHSHPENTPYPSGLEWDSTSGDVPFSGWAESILQQKPTFNIFLPENGKYVPFSPNSTPEDYGLKSQAQQLDEIIVVAPAPQPKKSK